MQIMPIAFYFSSPEIRHCLTPASSMTFRHFLIPASSMTFYIAYSLFPHPFYPMLCNLFRTASSLEVLFPFIFFFTQWENSHFCSYTFISFCTSLRPFMDRKNIVSAACVVVQSFISRAQASLSYNTLGRAGTAGS
jgi:hypothetical protein